MNLFSKNLLITYCVPSIGRRSIVFRGYTISVSLEEYVSIKYNCRQAMPMNLLVLFAINIFFPKLQTIQQSRKQFILAHSWAVAIAACAWDSWSYCIYRQEAESDEYQCSGHLLLYINQLRWIFLPQLSRK